LAHKKEKNYIVNFIVKIHTFIEDSIMSNSNDVKMFLEGCDWESLGLAPKKVVAESVEDHSEEVNESDDLEAGFYDVDGELFFVNEDQDIFDVFTDEDEQVFIFNENYGLHQVFEGEDSLMFEEVDAEGFEVLEEEADDDGEVVEEAKMKKMKMMPKKAKKGC